ncbi:MAG: helix-turn-helix transcriptional regulator [Hyphomicrobiales bacterium]|nr:helix-turn-helix transcriptional regulator [Hyphomicrobiales bacterium]
MLPPGAHLTWSFSTRGMAPEERLAALKGLSERGTLPIEPLPGRLPEVNVRRRTYGNVGILLGTLGGASQVVAANVPDFADEVFLGVNITGAAVVSHRGRELTRASGDGVLFLRPEAGFISSRPKPSLFLGVRAPRGSLAPLVANLDRPSMWAIPGQSRCLRLLTDYIRLVSRRETADSSDFGHAIATHILDLIALSVGADRDAEVAAAERGVRAARLQSIKADISSRLSDGDLSVAAVAAYHCVSSRYVHKLFETEGSTFSEYVLARRLELAYRLLTNPRLESRSITSIALDAGFADLSHFNRTFRRRYDATPTGARAEASHSSTR